MWYSLARSLVTHHWVFTLVILSVTMWGVAIAPTTDWHLVGLLVLALYLGIEGMHDLDLADPDVAVDVNPVVQRRIGFGLITAGVAVGVYLASLTTWVFLAFVVAETLAGLAYNDEWFDGLFHDVDKLGIHNAAFVLGFVPVLTGHFLVTQSVTLAAVLWGVVAALYSVGILHLFQVVKVPVLYERVGIRHTRTMEMDEDEVYEMVATGQLCVIVGTILAGVAFLAMNVGV
jgi:hypothetical protein